MQVTTRQQPWTTTTRPSTPQARRPTLGTRNLPALLPRLLATPTTGARTILPLPRRHTRSNRQTSTPAQNGVMPPHRACPPTRQGNPQRLWDGRHPRSTPQMNAHVHTHQQGAPLQNNSYQYAMDVFSGGEIQGQTAATTTKPPPLQTAPPQQAGKTQSAHPVSLGCELCQQFFEPEGRLAPCRITSCAHAFCRECLTGWAAQSQLQPEQGGPGFACPTCRAVCVAPVEKLQMNHVLYFRGVAERVATQVAPSYSSNSQARTVFACADCDDNAHLLTRTCKKHGDQDLRLFCISVRVADQLWYSKRACGP